MDFANEIHGWNNLTIDTPSSKLWIYHSKEMIELFHTQEMMNLGNNWYNYPELESKSYKEEMDRVQAESNRFFSSLGYQYIDNGKYKVINDNDDHVAMFAHPFISKWISPECIIMGTSLTEIYSSIDDIRELFISDLRYWYDLIIDSDNLRKENYN